MKRTVFTCNLSHESMQVQVQDAMRYTPAVLRITGEAVAIELLLTDEQMEIVEEVLAVYKARRLAKEGV